MDDRRQSFIGAGGGALVLACLIGVFLAGANLSAAGDSTGQTVVLACVVALEVVLIGGGGVLLFLGLRRG